jgi:P27 family predicted phage terminase small subunit
MKFQKVPPPEHLSARAVELWDAVVPRRCQSPERLAMLTAALEAFDRAAEARRVLEREGLTTKTKRTGAVHAHPMVKVESDARRQFARLWQGLALNWDGTIDGSL